MLNTLHLLYCLTGTQLSSVYSAVYTCRHSIRYNDWHRVGKGESIGTLVCIRTVYLNGWVDYIHVIYM